MTFENTCLLAPFCSQAGNERFCNSYCFAHTRLHGENGDGGLLAVANIPPKYKTSTIKRLPFKDANPRSYAIVEKFGRTVVQKVNEGIGLYLFGVPSKDNPKGTGTGKTTAATAIIIEYLRQRTMMEAKKERQIEGTPAYFMKMAKFQNIYNSQFRGSREVSEANADKYQALKKKMTNCDLLVLDDIGLRGTTEALQTEIYEIIDDRDTNERATIFTSNVPLDKLSEILSEQIASRIEGMTFAVPFTGKDNRKKNL